MNEIERPDVSPFDGIKRTDENGEYWTGRELQPLMDYPQWREFSVVIEKAKASLALVEGIAAAQHHFVEIPKMVSIGSGASREVPDFRLTRFGAYLTAMAGDDTKEAVARARIYFAVRAREAEVAEATRQAVIPTKLPAALRAYADEVEAHEQTRRQRDALLPLAEAYADLMETDGTFEWAAVAQIFSRITDGLGRNNLLELLRSDELKVLKDNNTPYQANFEPYFRLVPGGHGVKTTRVTPRGLDWLRQRLVKHFNHQPTLFAIGDIAS